MLRLQVKYVILGMLEETKVGPPRNPAYGVLEGFWPAEVPTTVAIFERCLVRLQRETGLDAPIIRHESHGQVSFASPLLAGVLDAWYNGAPAMHYGLLPPLEGWDGRNDAARISFVKGVLLRVRPAAATAEAWYPGPSSLDRCLALYRVLTELRCHGAAIRYSADEGGGHGVVIPKTPETMRIWDLALPW